MFYNCLSTVPCGPTEDSGNTEGDVIDWKLYPLSRWLLLRRTHVSLGVPGSSIWLKGRRLCDSLILLLLAQVPVNGSSKRGQVEHRKRRGTPTDSGHPPMAMVGCGKKLVEEGPQPFFSPFWNF